MSAREDSQLSSWNQDRYGSLDAYCLGWSGAMAPVIMGNPVRPELGEELTNSFCRTDPEIARVFARVTFLSDNRAHLAAVLAPTPVAQCSSDAIAPPEVGAYVHAPDPGKPTGDAERDGALPSACRTGGDRRGDHRVRRDGTMM